MPFAGPELYENIKTPGMTAHQEPYTGPESDLKGLEEYLVEHYREGTYLVVAQRANDVAGLIIDTGLPAVAYGGFLGWDGAISLDELKVLVDEGVVTYFLAPSSGLGGARRRSRAMSQRTRGCPRVGIRRSEFVRAVVFVL
jgi:hypothetical protein